MGVVTEFQLNIQSRMTRLTLDEAFMTLQGGGPVLDIALEVSRILRDANLDGAIIGGVAVALHGYLRTTVDVDVFVESDASQLDKHLLARGYAFDEKGRQFVKRNVPVHIVTRAQLETPPRHFEIIEGMRTVSLADLISMKLRSGTRSVLRAKDLGDVIGLIRHHNLTGEFTAGIEPSLRAEFRRLLDAIESERRER